MNEKRQALFCHDEKLLRTAVKNDNRNNQNYAVTTARSLGHLRRILVEGRKFDVAVVDVGLGVVENQRDILSGKEAAKILIDQGTKVALMSGDFNAQTRGIANELGVQLFYCLDYGINKVTLFDDVFNGRQLRVNPRFFNLTKRSPKSPMAHDGD